MIIKAVKNRKIIIGGGILAVLVLHFVFQFSFIQNENLQTIQDVTRAVPFERYKDLPKPVVENAVETESEQETEIVEDETASEAETEDIHKPQKAKVLRKSKPVQIRSKPAPSRTVIRKKTPPSQTETRAERLRRAERILTGA